VCGLLERFGGYTLGTLLAEEPELLRLVQIEALGRREQTGDGEELLAQAREAAG
jgi:hypothetical protein